MAKGIVDPSELPPTDSAAYQHTLRAVYQATVWDKLDEFCLDPCQYGWDLVDSFHSPVANSQSCAPDNLLKLVRCKCESGCQSALCSCRKHGLSCAVACQNCRGTCENSHNNQFNKTNILFFSMVDCSVRKMMLMKIKFHCSFQYLFDFFNNCLNNLFFSDKWH